MHSLTKNQQSPDAIRAMTEKIFGSGAYAAHKELTEGYFNVAYEVTLTNGTQTILKVAPAPGVRVMTYEINIMRSEVQAMRMVQAAGDIPAPCVLGYDDSCTLCASPYFFMDKLPGRSLNSIRETLTGEQIRAIHEESGRINRRINEIACPCFGYPGQEAFQGSDWYEVFQKMLTGGVEDAYRAGVDLKIDVQELFRRLERDKAYFDEVTQPRLVHWDCWDGNLFVENGRITGFIDWERAIWGDPLLEVGFRTYADDRDFLRGYGLETLSLSQHRRALWYDVYLLLLVSLECEYRQYETLDMYNWSVNLLQKQFAHLG